jgi:hypothetical protein
MNRSDWSNQSDESDRGTAMMIQRLLWCLAGIAILSQAAEDGQKPLLERLGIGLHGFADVRGGVRTSGTSLVSDGSVLEGRLQLLANRYGDIFTLQLRTDFLYDALAEDHNFDLNTGKGEMDLREAYVLFSPFEFMDVKAGRQILTWGTGDLVFLNDLFPKDWQAFFLGRDQEYLKAPSDALLVSLFPSFANIDVVFVPQFDPDRYVRGERLVFWNPGVQDLVGRDDPINVETPNRWFKDVEVALRVSKNVHGMELAAYGYTGFWKSPAGSDPLTGDAVFPRLNVWGASARTDVLGGIGNAEFAYYDSREDRDGDDPFVPNSEWRFLLGYERELARNLTMACQYYAEWMQDYSAYTSTLPMGIAQDELRHYVTLRLTKLMMNQNLTLSFFVRYSPSDDDAYLRPTVSYKVTDNWLVTAGGNVFLGSQNYTFLGQFQENSNVYAAVRYSF